jgi:hypothetical protein
MAFLIDKYLPEYTYNEYHQKLIHASAKKSFLATRDLDMRKSFISMFLFKLRRLPTNDLYLQEFLRNMCFVYLEEEPFKEFVIDASQPGLKMFWNFYFKEISENITMVSTETRILCLTKKSKLIFSLYWFFVKPFSGLIRIEMLRLLRKKVENN